LINLRQLPHRLSPLHIIAIVFIFSEALLVAGASLMKGVTQTILVWFAGGLGAFVIIAFFGTLWFKRVAFYTPYDFRDEILFYLLTQTRQKPQIIALIKNWLLAPRSQPGVPFETILAKDSFDRYERLDPVGRRLAAYIFREKTVDIQSESLCVRLGVKDGDQNANDLLFQQAKILANEYGWARLEKTRLLLTEEGSRELSAVMAVFEPLLQPA
jgi:hypothetical protein